MARFRAILVFEGLDTGDRRRIDVGALSTRALPLTLMGMTRNPDGGWGHDGAEVVGRIDTAVREDASEWVDEATGDTWATVAGGPVFAWVGEGEFDDRDEAADVEQLVRDRHLRGISVDLAEVTSEMEVLEEDEDGWPVDWLDHVTEGNIAAATVVNIPAFRGCTVELADDTPAEDAEALPEDDVAAAVAASAAASPFRIVNDGPGCEPCASDPAAAASLTASGGPLHPPAAWFADPGLPGPTGLTLDDDGRVYGHLATWGTCHVGFAGQCITPPKSGSGYSLFRLGAVRAADGSDVPVGHITLGTGHASLRATRAAAAEHYDHTGTAVADISAGEDAHGIWVAGALRPDVTDEQVRTLRSASLSGDWRQHGGRLEMVAALAVNVPGFPVPRTQAIAASGVPTALVAAGAVAASRIDAEPAKPLTPMDRLVLTLARREALRVLTSPRP